ncbi:MAG: lysophospholipid acyltransferase family protein, partial [Nevskiaceae bacterium]|nr:lysophospholipid acyltransferase family protein [Nevskiaceae bacterium]
MNPGIMPEERVSKRRLTPLRRFAYWLLAPVGYAVLRVWWGTCRIVAVSGAEHFDAALARAPSLLPCYWHQHEMFCARWLLRQRSRIKLGFLISPSVDGEIPAKVARRLGAQVIRGSSTHTGARALRDYYQLLVKDNVSPVITPDGPKGPRFVFKTGAILLAQISGRPMLPMAYAASRVWIFGWDKFVLPRPFARIAIAIGEPVWVERSVAVSDADTM